MYCGADTFMHVTMESRFPGTLTPRDERPSWTVPHTPLALRGMESDIQSCPAIASYADKVECAAGRLRTRGPDLGRATSVRFGFSGDELQLGPHIGIGDFSMRVLSEVASWRGTKLKYCQHFGVSSLGFIDQLLLVYVHVPHSDPSAPAPAAAHEYMFSVILDNVENMYFWALCCDTNEVIPWTAVLQLADPDIPTPDNTYRRVRG